ncbi:MAG: dehydrogenase, partial [Eggerthellaceae bacterium]|nr:dehydrogenase [Eggerthellaceae bacterium]
LERPTIHTNYGVTDSIICSERAIDPMYERHTDYTFWKELGLATGQDPDMWPWEKEEDVFYYILSPLNYPVSSYDEFVENYRAYYPPLRYYKYGDAGFCTASGKVELKSSVLEELGYPALPTYTPCAENEIDNPEVAKEYPLVLTTGGGFMPYHHSEEFQITSVRYLYPDPYFDINPKTAEKLGICAGDWCWIETRRGRIRQRANVEPATDPRVICAQRGWWYPELDLADDPDAPYGCLTSNVNVLTSVDDEHCDPIGGSWANRGLLCKVYKVKPSEMHEKADTAYSIPGSADKPGIWEMPSEAHLAYEPIHYDPKPDFEVPEGLVWDKLRKVAFQEDTG